MFTSTSRFEIVESEKAPKVMVCSQAVIPKNEGVPVYFSGQVGLDPKTMKLVEDGIEAQTRQTFANIRAVLKEAGLTLNDVSRMEVLLEPMNAIYMSEFGQHRPARAAYEIAKLPMGAKVEMVATAWRPTKASILLYLSQKFDVIPQ